MLNEPQLNEYPQQLFTTLTFRGTRNHEQSKQKLDEQVTDLWKTEHIQLGYSGVMYSNHTQTHIHLLMLGKNKHGKTLFDIDMRQQERHWKYGKAEIGPVLNSIGSAVYIQSHMSTNHPDSWKALDYGSKQWKRLRLARSAFH